MRKKLIALFFTFSLLASLTIPNSVAANQAEPLLKLFVKNKGVTMSKCFTCFICLTYFLSFLSFPTSTVSANDVTQESQKIYAPGTHIAITLDKATSPSIIIVGKTGQIRRSKDDPYYDLHYSLSFNSYDSSILSINEKGEWRALKPGKTIVNIEHAYPGNKPALATEMREKGFALPNAPQSPVPSIQAVNQWEVTVVDTSWFKPMYRLYNPNNLEHFYTSSEHEKNTLVKIGWGHYEGIAWTAPSEGKPVFRLYNPILKDHHYTTNAHEVEVLVSKHHWIKEGIAWYSGGEKEIYRLFHPGLTSGSHHYTNDLNEVTILQTRGWIDEGIAWYGQ